MQNLLHVAKEKKETHFKFMDLCACRPLGQSDIFNCFTTLSGFFAPTFAWKLSLGVKLCNCSPARGWRADACLHTAEVSLGITSSTATSPPARSGHVWWMCKVLSVRCVLISFQMSHARFKPKRSGFCTVCFKSPVLGRGGIVFVILHLLVWLLAEETI